MSAIQPSPHDNTNIIAPERISNIPAYARDIDRPYVGELGCTKCGEWKPDSEFPVQRRQRLRRGRAHWCKVCKSEWGKEDRRKNPEKLRERSKIGESQRSPEKRKAKWDKWYSVPANRDALLARKRQKTKEPEELARQTKRNRDWRRRNPEKHREYSRRYEQRRSQATVEKVDYVQIRVRDNDICHICGLAVTEETLSFDHVVPLARGGLHSYDNVKIAHKTCNFSKGARWWS